MAYDEPASADIEQQSITTLDHFYKLMHQTCSVRTSIVNDILAGKPAAPDAIQSLNNARISLENIATAPNGAILALDRTSRITLDLSYEVLELEKDIIYLTDGVEALMRHFNNIHDGFDKQVDAGVAFLSDVSFATFITDRDGTVNNYCGRYLSSIQSVYNAIFLALFARKCITHGVILTSAPLANGGLVDISVLPPGEFILAGSKGREFRDRAGQLRMLEIPSQQQELLDTLNARLSELLAQPGNEKFALIGSGYQQKFGQSTLARQDITKSIPAAESQNLLESVTSLVAELDPHHTGLRIEDTGLDIEIMLTIDNDGQSKDFDKGDGVLFLDRELNLEIGTGPNLVCGDTGSDVAMARTCSERCSQSYSVFVTTKKELRQSVTDACPHSFFATTPDVLVTMLYELANHGITPERES
ncbi:MAG: trehalose 6-phosphate synthase [Chitinivibrionales bacterium]|nr:trehalose 6-phosphate synthase [Chitinivibrionales bacterium]